MIFSANQGEVGEIIGYLLPPISIELKMGDDDHGILICRFFFSIYLFFIYFNT